MGKSKAKKEEQPVIVPKVEEPKEVKVYQPLYKAMAEDVVIKPWGSYAVLDNGPGWKTKKIQVNPGLRFSLQSHAKREEIWTVVEGRGMLSLKDSTKYRDMGPGDVCFIPIGTRHRMKCISDIPLVFIEVQRGESLDESDIVRHEDDFGRK